MESQVPIVPFTALLYLLLLLYLSPETCMGSTQRTQISPGFRATQIKWIDNAGLFLLSNDSRFAFGFINSGADATKFLLGVIHLKTMKIVWAANRGSLIVNTDAFAFGGNGDVFLNSGNTTIWSTGTSNRGANSMSLDDSGNLVLLSNDSSLLWHSFDHPSDTLLSGQRFVEGMRLTSDPSSNNLSFHLEFASGDARLFADFAPPQQYWSMRSDGRAIMNKAGDVSIHSANLTSNSWKFYDQNQDLLLQFILSGDSNSSAMWAATLLQDGSITFLNLQSGIPEAKRIPEDSCDAPVSCKPYHICGSDRSCLCPPILGSNCEPDIDLCNSTNGSVDLVKVGDGIGYSAIRFTSPVMKSDIATCRDACVNNCSCLVMFFDGSSGNCFMFNHIGSLQQQSSNTNRNNSYSSFIKVSKNRGASATNSRKHVAIIIVVVIAILTVLVLATIIYAAIRRLRRKNPPFDPDSSDEDYFLESMLGRPVRFTYGELERATANFSTKLGGGGFGSVYQGKLPDGTRIAVKKLEGIGQGKKEFRAEVSIIGSVHHLHLVRLKGFCAEGSHRLLAYEYMSRGSLDRWIFGGEICQLDWEKRFNIALGTAKGLAYLHEDCDSKIVHCDIKPENVLLDENFLAKVSDFGLAKLMTREQSHVCTTMRGTRGYLAPEWITEYAISEKSDVYSYGMVLLEIVGGRKNYDPGEADSEKAHFPTYAWKMMEEGRLEEVVVNAGLEFDERVMRVVKVALWCIQEDVMMRPSMARVVQMLEGVVCVPQPPASSQMGFRLYSNLFKSIGSEGTSSGPSDGNGVTFISDVRLSGPR
ncbi:G-type lectin S-receptor-like serine/threonine-protein kinase SD2-5 [Acorus gramineus]|uniref:Receptor-like serine/threonine-protein kinase n=1 Tax=Acorus gramineus TaxID=55184 RepID=A0AAV9AKZ1_ACOGR|nr:G-type lectin S-receptor-like serine/threonine-protein kinase SD2-5 [Acorus gramineus]